MVENYMNEKQKRLAGLPSVDEILKSGEGVEWLNTYPRKYVLLGIREAIDLRRKEIIEGLAVDFSEEVMRADIERIIKRLSLFSLKPLINATGVVIHTNLGRSTLSERALENIRIVSENYSNLEYDIEKGKRGKRYTHIKRILREIIRQPGMHLSSTTTPRLSCCALIRSQKAERVIVSRVNWSK
jgi:L-seryl-tRNA(Ser) seleniumtransferase